MNYRKVIFAAVLAPVLAVAAGAANRAHAAGFAIFTQGASALGQGNAVTAHSDNPSTIFYNPALIGKLDGTQLQVGTTAIFSSREFHSNQPGGSNDSDESTFFPSTFYATHKISDNLSAGLGVFSPFGLGTEWSDNWDGRYLATESKLTTFNVNPVISYRVLPSLSVAAGVDVMFLDATLKRMAVNSAALGIPGPAFDIRSKFDGDGTGVGFNLGLAYDISKDITFGAHYRSQVHVNIDGKSSTSPSVAALGLDSKGETSVNLPPQVTAALAYRVAEPLVLEAGIRWEGWSSFKQLKLELDNGNTVTTPRDWHDSFGFNVGGKYKVNDAVGLMAGYVFGNSAVPNSTFDPSIPDAKTHVFCLGSDVNFQQVSVALSYAYQLYEDRTKNNNVDAAVPISPTNKANGRYESDAHLVAVSLGYKF